jgi:hypothetical protein
MRPRPFTTVFAILLILATSTGPALGYYNPKLGRFMQRDPVGAVNAAQITPLVNRGAAFIPRLTVPWPPDEYYSGPNLYQYAGSSPYDIRDPTGRYDFSGASDSIDYLIMDFTGEKLAALQAIADKVRWGEHFYKAGIRVGLSANKWTAAAMLVHDVASGELVEQLLDTFDAYYAIFRGNISFQNVLIAGLGSIDIVCGVKGAARTAKLAARASVRRGVMRAKYRAPKPKQDHHFSTTKHSYYTPRMKRIAEKYNLDLEDPWNRRILSHQGRHPHTYHDWVLGEMEAIDLEAAGDVEMFLDLYQERVINPVLDDPSLLTREAWR